MADTAPSAATHSPPAAAAPQTSAFAEAPSASLDTGFAPPLLVSEQCLEVVRTCVGGGPLHGPDVVGLVGEARVLDQPVAVRVEVLHPLHRQAGRQDGKAKGRAEWVSEASREVQGLVRS